MIKAMQKEDEEEIDDDGRQSSTSEWVPEETQQLDS